MKTVSAFLRLVFFFTIVSTVFGCFSIGVDTAFAVKGKITNPTEDETVRCAIGIFRETRGSFVKARNIGEEFNLTFTIDPKPDWYYFVIECEDLGCHKTEPFYLGTSETYPTPVDLGEILPRSFSSCKNGMVLVH